MIYLLDTNTCIRYLTQRSSAVVTRVSATAPNDMSLCSIVQAELYFGAYNSARPASNLAVLSNFFSLFSCLPFDDKAAEIYGRERARLNSLGTPTGHNDLMIASIALANNLTLVTHNTREFSRIAGLQLEDWE